MCPMCISTAAWLVVGSVSTGSILTLGLNYLRKPAVNKESSNKKTA